MAGEDDGAADQPCPAGEPHVAATGSGRADQTPQQELRYAAFARPFSWIRDERDEREGRGFFYEVGKTYSIPEGRSPAEPRLGFLSYDNPIDALKDHALGLDRITTVRIGGEIKRYYDGEVRSAEITILEDLTLSAFTQHALAWIKDQKQHRPTSDRPAEVATTERKAPAVAAHADAKAMTTGHEAHALTGGRRGYAVTVGEGGSAVATGRASSAATVGDGAHAMAISLGAQAVTSGRRSLAIAIGRVVSAKTTGDESHAVTLGGKAITCGHAAHAINFSHGWTQAGGDHAVAINFTGPSANAYGNSAMALTLNKKAYAVTTGRNAVACSLGPNGIAVAEAGSWIILAAHDDDGTITHIHAAKVGRNGIYPGLPYYLSKKGRFKRYAPTDDPDTVWPRYAREPFHLRIYHKIYDFITGRVPKFRGVPLPKDEGRQDGRPYGNDTT